MAVRHPKPRDARKTSLTSATQDPAMDWYEALVTKTLGVQGGAAFLAGTRTPVGTVVANFRNY